MADATITVVNDQVSASPFGADALTPLISLTSGYKDAAAASAAAAAASTASVRTPNILFDSFNNNTALNTTLAGWTWYDVLVPAFSTSSANIPIATPVAIMSSSQTFRKVWDISKLNLAVGDVISLAALGYSPVSGGLRIEAYIRGPSPATTNLASSVGAYSGVSGVQEVRTQITVPSGAARLIVQVNVFGSGSYEVAGVFGTKGTAPPALTAQAPDATYYLEALKAAGLTTLLATKANAADVQNFTRASTNLFNKNDPGIVTGKYIVGSTGAEASNATYNASPLIPVAASTQYTFSRTGQLAWYTSAGAYISGETATVDNTPLTVPSPSTAAFVRVSVKVAWMDDFRINLGASVLAYEVGGKVFDYAAVQTSVQADITTALTGAGVSNTNLAIVGSSYIKRWRVNMRKRLRGQTAKLRAAFHMDSYGTNNNISKAVSFDNLRLYNGGGLTAVGFAGPGWIGATYVSGAVKSSIGVALGLYSVARTGTWTDNFGTDIYSPDVCSASTTDTTATYTFASTNTGNIPTSMILLVAGSGSFDYSWDGTSWTTVTLTSTTRQAVTLAGLPGTAAWILRLRWPSASTFKVMGLQPDTADNGLVFNAINATGTRLQQRAATDATAFAANAALINPDIVFLGTPINDRNASRTVAQWKADLQTVIGLWRAWDPTVDIVVIMPPEVGGANTTTPPMGDYLAAALSLVDTQRICVVNFQPLCGAAVANYQNSNSRNSLLDAADTHLIGANNDGFFLYQDTLVQLLTASA
jgi:hypothetical protein